MLGEAARTRAQVDDYYQAYRNAIDVAGRSANETLLSRPGISVKLSALHPRYEPYQRERVRHELLARLRGLCMAARDRNISLTLDAEEAQRLGMQLELLEALMAEPALSQWEGLGIAVQAYQKRACAVIDRLDELATRHGRRLLVRLVKGAYWDTEIKHSQVLGLTDYPVFTRKQATDVSYLVCARGRLYPQLATHNAHTLAAVLAMAGGDKALEFQRLHGMGEALYHHLRRRHPDVDCRIYAPVGSHEHLLAYLVRRLLENGANSSFVNRIHDPSIPPEALSADPVAELEHRRPLRHPRIPRPGDIYASRRNSAGLDLTDPTVLRPLAQARQGGRSPWRNRGLSIGATPPPRHVQPHWNA